MTDILPPTDENLARAVAALAQGEVVGLPTETVYGLAGRLFDEAALAKIFSAKERPTFDPLIAHLAPRPSDSTDWTAYLAEQRLLDRAPLSPAACARIQCLANAFWPGPLTLVLPKQAAVPDLATSGLPTVAVRVPRHPIAQAVLARLGTPLAAPSANRFGRISPTSADDVRAELNGRIGLILDGGACEIGLESTVVAVAPDGELTLLRPGGVAAAAIEAAAEAPLHSPAPAEASGAQAAPGMLASHYAPTKPLRMLPAAIEELNREHMESLVALTADVRQLGVLLQRGDATRAARLRDFLPSDATLHVEVLSPTADGAEAARRLFASLRALDARQDVALILAEPPPHSTGLWHAIADRLRRASA